MGRTQCSRNSGRTGTLINKSIWDLVYEYVIELYPDVKPNINEKRLATGEISNLLRRGFTDQDITNLIQTLPVVHGISLSHEQQSLPLNLLRNPGEIYYHNQLHIISNPPQVLLDIKSGELIRITDEFFLEMRASYTITELITHYSRLQKVDLNKDMKRSQGSFEWLLKNNSLDIILFTIDYVTDHDIKLKAPISLNQYIALGEEQRKEKINELKLMGSDWCVPKRRLQLG